MPVPIFLRLLTLGLITLALSRPQQVTSDREVRTEGIDIVLAIDVSGSMMAEDFKLRSRLAVALTEAKKFVEARKHNRIGLVVFSSQSFTQCPLTLDHDVLIRLMDEVRTGLIKDGTAIGLAIGNAVNRLRDSSAKSKVVILLTDGENNAGNIDPVTAAELAKGFGIKIYTIGVGKEGLVPFPVDDPLFGKRYVQAKVDIDEATLKVIATVTGGQFFRAHDEKALAEIYHEIDQFERTEMKVRQYTNYNELFPWLIYPALVVLLAIMVMDGGFLLKVP